VWSTTAIGKPQSSFLDGLLASPALVRRFVVVIHFSSPGANHSSLPHEFVNADSYIQKHHRCLLTAIGGKKLPLRA
jgi:hypothetical protein